MFDGKLENFPRFVTRKGSPQISKISLFGEIAKITREELPKFIEDLVRLVRRDVIVHGRFAHLECVHSHDYEYSITSDKRNASPPLIDVHISISPREQRASKRRCVRTNGVPALDRGQRYRLSASHRAITERMVARAGPESWAPDLIYCETRRNETSAVPGRQFSR